eukprot:gene30859-20873_t
MFTTAVLLLTSTMLASLASHYTPTSSIFNATDFNAFLVAQASNTEVVVTAGKYTIPQATGDEAHPVPSPNAGMQHRVWSPADLI